jgi:hypothetical protein
MLKETTEIEKNNIYMHVESMFIPNSVKKLGCIIYAGLQYMKIYPACLGREGCWIGCLSRIWVARPKMYKKAQE